VWSELAFLLKTYVARHTAGDDIQAAHASFAYSSAIDCTGRVGYAAFRFPLDSAHRLDRVFAFVAQTTGETTLLVITACAEGSVGRVD
jgi:hypothetical protein